MPKKIPKRANVTYFKRKRGLIKKCIEISTLCNQKVYLYMANSDNDQLVEYCSSPEFNVNEVLRTKRDHQKNNQNFSKYENLDLQLLVNSMTPFQFKALETAYKRKLGLGKEENQESGQVSIPLG